MYPIISEVSIEYKDVRYRTKNECGQILNLTFFLEKVKNKNEWFITFWIGKRKKGFQEFTQTGKDGIKSLLWAKECVKDFIKNLDRTENHKIIVHWDNNRRRDIYARGLKDLGFTYQSGYGGRKILILIINNK